MNTVEPVEPVVGPSIDKALVDIVFVHGLNSDYKRTWCNSDASVFWPKELLPQEFPSARVFCYGYQMLSHSWEDGNVSNDFSNYLQRFQVSRAEHQIPIVFIAHSLGGMILRDALNRERRDPESRVLEQTRWMCFLGTPCFTSDTDWLDFGQRLPLDQADLQDKSLLYLPRMQAINDEFESWLKTSPHRKIEICCFYEVLPIEGNGILAPKEAVRLPGHDYGPILKNHFDFTKVENSIDPLYRTVCDRLRAKLDGSSVLAADLRSASRVSSRRTSSTDGREEAIESPSTPEDAKDPTRLALALEDRGKMKAAYEALTHLIDVILKKRLVDASTKDRIVFFCYDKLASVLRKCGRFEEAEAKCREVLEVKRRELGLSDAATLDTVGNLALILRSRGRFREAIQELTDNLEPSPQYTNEPIVHIKLFSILSKVYKDIGYFNLAELLARDVLIASIKHFGVEHSFTLTRASDLAVVLAKQRKYDFAEELSRRSLYLLERLLGTDHRYSLRASQRLAFINLFQGKLNEAARRFERTRLLQQEQLGFYHQNTLSTTCGLGTALVRQGNIQDGEVYLDSALQGQASLLGKNHPDTMWTARLLEHIQKSKTRSKSWLLLFEEDKELHEFVRRPSRPQDIHPMFPEVSSIYAPGAMNSSNSWNFRLRLAALEGDHVGLLEALDHGAEMNSVGGILGSPLQAACYSGRTDIVEELLSRNEIDVNIQGGLFGTPLRAAAFSGFEDLVTRLLNKKDNGALPNITDGIRGSALGAALVTDNTGVVKALLKGGANKYSNDDIYGTALHEAAMNGQDKMVEILLDEGANPNVRAGLFGTAIEASAWGGHTATISLLLGRGASLDNRYEGRNAVYLASARGHHKALLLLQKKLRELKEESGRVLRRDASSELTALAASGQSPPGSKSGKSSEERAEDSEAIPMMMAARQSKDQTRLFGKSYRKLTYRFRRRAA